MKVLSKLILVFLILIIISCGKEPTLNEEIKSPIEEGSLLEKEYRIVKKENFSIGVYKDFPGAKRMQYNIEVSSECSDENIKDILKKAVENLKEDWDALAVYLFFEGTDLPYAIADWAPHGKWEEARRGQPKSIFKLSVKIFKDRRPSEESSKEQWGLSSEIRKKIYWDINGAYDKAMNEAIERYKYDAMKQIDYERALQKEYLKKVREKYNITEEQQKQIQIEGIKNNWPTPEL